VKVRATKGGGEEKRIPTLHTKATFSSAPFHSTGDSKKKIFFENMAGVLPFIREKKNLE
jgi:hypothetical protein